MAKTNMVEREKRRARLVKKYAAKRAAAQGNHSRPEVQRRRARGGAGRAQTQPRDASPCASATAARLPAVRAACTANSAWRACKIREAAMRGEITGLGKASW